MLNSETKKHIDAARQVLVGVSPNPMTQIDQITYALIYKFMDDMDQAAIKAGGEPSFFTGELERYAWSKLLDSRMGNQERMNLYGEALQKFSEAKQLPELFRTIFRSAFLPYRNPEVLGLFLKEICFFDYSHPEELGNAYEYLLSIMSAQGDAGQFRTPRHIIEFMVDVMNPTKDDTVLDPACGTGGFLVASYNHINEKHSGKKDLENQLQPLTPDQRKKLMNNFEGYDIDPSMVRIAQVNMYLHQFKNPKIFQYDSLTSEEKWNDKFDVILANPPFMSPKGGIKPNNKFGIQSNRSEVLFVDYIVSHLKPNGRAAIIVPEGIVFQSGKAYKQLRKELVEGGLFAVVSLPSGVFNPYSGVKTSILLINNTLAKQNHEVLFVKITADGFDLGATKRLIKKNDIPEALKIIEQFSANKFQGSPIASLISRTQIAATGDLNLSSERYLETPTSGQSSWPLVELVEVSKIASGNSAPQGDENYLNGTYPFFRTSDVGSVHLSNKLVETRDKLTQEATSGMKLFPAKTILFPKSGASTFLNHRVLMGVDGYVSSHLATITTDSTRLLPDFAYYMLTKVDARTLTADQSYPSLRLGDIERITIPLPPLDVQEKIVAELDRDTAVIDGAKKVLANWKPTIDINPVWEEMELGELCTVYQPKTISGAEIQKTGEYVVYGANGPIGFYDKFNHEESQLTVTCRGATCGTVNFTVPKSWITGNAMVIAPKDERVSKEFLKFLLSGMSLKSVITGSAQPQITAASLKPFKIPVPPLGTQEEIVSHLKKQEDLVQSLNNFVLQHELKISNVIESLWDK